MAAANYSWTPTPIVLILVGLAGTVYVRRWVAVRREHGVRGASGWRLAAFLGGLACVIIALVSPVDALSDQLALMHMTQHMLLLDAVPILCILGLTKILLRPVTRRVHRLERALGPLAHPVAAVIAYAGLLWLWHVPALYDAALAHEPIHVLEHTCFAVAGAMYWWHLLSPIRTRVHLTGVQTAVYMVATRVLVGLLGIVLTFAPVVLYDYAHQPRVWGLSHQADQAIGGAIMALEQSIVMGVALCLLFARGLAESEREQLRVERLEDAAAAEAEAV